jgi:hypothetical protein
MAAAMSSAARRSSRRHVRFARSLLAVKRYASVWRWTTVLQPLCRSLGRIHPDKVMASSTSSEADPGTRTTASTPLKLSAFPYRPRAQLPP